MVVTRRFIIIILCFFFFSCHENKEYDLYFEATSPSGEIVQNGISYLKIEGEKLVLSQDILSAEKIKVLNNHIYILTDGSEHPISKFDLSGEFKGRLLTHGIGPGEVQHIVNFGISTRQGKSAFYAADMMQKKLVYKKDKETIDVKFNKWITNFFPISDTKILGVPLEAEKMFSIYNFSGETIHSFGDFPANDLTDAPFVLSQAFGGSYDYNVAKDIFVAALRYTDHLMIYSNLSQETDYLKVRGPLFYDPIFTVGNMNGRPMFVQGQDGRFSFIDVTLSKDNIICLFSGYSREELPGQANFGDKIFIFDYKGKILKAFEISEKLLSISYDESNKVLYGLDVSAEEEEVFRYKLK